MAKIVSINMSKADVFNARNGKKIQGNEGVEGVLNGCAVKYDDVDTVSGEDKERKVAILKIDGEVYSGTSGTVANDILEIMDSFSEDIEAGTLRVRIGTKLSGQGRTFYTLSIC